MRAISVIFMAGAVLTGFWWCALPAFFAHLYSYKAFEVPVIALLIDAYFGTFHTFPYLSVITLLSVAVFEYFKPRLLFYEV